MTLREIEIKLAKKDKLSTAEEDYLRQKIETIWENHPDVSIRFPRLKKIMAWIAGYQYYDYNTVSKKLLPVKVERTRKLVFNRMRGFVRTLLGKLTSDVPNMGVVPNTSEDEDLEASRIGDKIIEGLVDKLGFRQILDKLKAWLIISGTAYLRVFWNKDDFGIVEYRREIDQTTGEEIVVQITEEGDVGMEAVSPFHCRHDPLNTDHDKWRWFVYGEEVDAEALEDEYGLERGSLQETSNRLDTSLDVEVAAGDVAIGAPEKKDDVTGRTIVRKELWTPRMFVVTAGSKVLEYGGNPYGTIPFFKAEDILIPISHDEKGILYNQPMLRDLIPVQREYNRQKSLMSLAIERATKLKVLVPAGSMLNKKFFNDEYGVFIDYTPKMGGEPHQMKLDPLPPDIHTYSAGLENEFYHIAGLHEASFGQLPERASHASGSLVSLLLEQDEIVLNPLLASLNAMLSKAWTLALQMVQNNYAVPRLIKYVGWDNQNAVIKFMGADLKGNTDVRVTSQMGLPRSRALKIEYIMRLRQAGLLTDDKANLEMLEFPNTDKVFQDALLHERRAQRENSMIEKNPFISPQEVLGWLYPFENHGVHFKIHLRDRLGAKWDSYSPNQKQALDLHIQATHQILVQQMQSQMQQRQPIRPQKPIARPGGGARVPQEQPQPTSAGEVL